MKILHIAPIPSSQASGFLHSILGLAQAQAALGNEVAVACSDPDSFSKNLCPSNVLYFKGPKNRHINLFSYPKNWFKNIEEKFGLPEIVNFHGTYIPLHFGLANYLYSKQIPYIHTPRGDLKSFAQNSKWLKKRIANILVVNRYLRRSSAIHALTDIELDEIKVRFPKEANKIFILPNGINILSDLNEIASLKFLNNSKTLKLILIGRIDFEIKGIDLILEALLLLEKRVSNPDFSFTLIGPFYTDLDQKKFNEFNEKFTNKSKIIYKGPLFGKEKIHELLKSDVFVCTSRSEGMPMALLEAMSVGLPCLVTPGSNAKSYVVDTDAGWYTNQDALSISIKIEEMLKISKSKYMRMGQNARNFVSNNFDWSSIAIRSIAVYKNSMI